MTFDLGVVVSATFHSFSDYGNVRTWGNVVGLPAVNQSARVIPGMPGKVFAPLVPHDRQFQVGLMLIGDDEADAMDRAIELAGFLWSPDAELTFRRIIPSGGGDLTHEAAGRYLGGFEMPLEGRALYSTMVLEFELTDAYWSAGGTPVDY